MSPESVPEHGSSSSSIRRKNSSSADTPSQRVLVNILAHCLLASTKAKKLKFAGRVGTGFSEKLLSTLFSKLDKIRIEKCPFYNLPAVGRSRWDQGLIAAEMRRCHWVKPAMVCQIKFTEWTRDDLLRQPVFLRIMEDKNANEVARENAS
jgi:ATP-dependent DNA ligase